MFSLRCDKVFLFSIDLCPTVLQNCPYLTWLNWNVRRVIQTENTFPSHFVCLGPRGCSGEKLARLEAFIFTVTLLQHFELPPKNTYSFIS